MASGWLRMPFQIVVLEVVRGRSVVMHIPWFHMWIRIISDGAFRKLQYAPIFRRSVTFDDLVDEVEIDYLSVRSEGFRGLGAGWPRMGV